jgi:hypothetical protein
LVPKGGHQHHSTLLLRRGGNQRAPSEDYTSSITPVNSTSTSTTIAASSTTSTTTKQKVRNSKLQLRSSLLIYCSLSPFITMTLLYIGMGVDGNFSPKPLVVIFFRAPGGRGLYKKLLEPTQRPTNPYMGWATPPTLVSTDLCRICDEGPFVCDSKPPKGPFLQDSSFYPLK